MSFTLDDARSYIAKVRWQFATTMPQWPHEYTVLRWRPEHEAEFFELVSLIRSDGVVKPWPRDSVTPRYHHHYLEVDGWEYWTMDEVLADTVLINRARVDDGVHRSVDPKTP
jgi:hypothetical protein